MIVEIFPYDEEDVEDGQRERLLQNVRKVSGLLSGTGRPEFHILTCRGFFQDGDRRELGLVFEPPINFEDPSPLTTLLQLYEKYPMMPLGHRIHLAHSLVVAMEHFHRVGWIHKSFRSKNVVFCSLSDSADSVSHGEDYGHEEDKNIPRWKEFDLSKPCIFGYDDAGPADVGSHGKEDHLLENNLYRHPDRWGSPRMRFEKVHDVFALVSLIPCSLSVAVFIMT